MFESESSKAERREFETKLKETGDEAYESVADCAQAVLDWGDQATTGLEPDDLMPPLPPELKARIEDVTNKMTAVRKMAEQGRV